MFVKAGKTMMTRNCSTAVSTTTVRQSFKYRIAWRRAEEQ